MMSLSDIGFMLKTYSILYAIYYGYLAKGKA